MALLRFRKKSRVLDSPDRHPAVLQVTPQLLATTIVSWLSIIVGYASAYSSPAESTMTQELNITKSESSWICSLLPVGALIGSLSGGLFVEVIGRKNTLIVTDVIFLISWSINYLSQNFWDMYISRILNGYSVGVISFALPVYLAETLQPTIRGRLGLFPTAFGNFGILMCFVNGSIFGWKELALFGTFLSLPFLIFVCIIPETPQWYISKNKLEKAQKSLQFFYGTDVSKKELENLQQQDQSSKNAKFSKSHFKIFTIVLGLMFFQQFSGINAVLFYTTRIFENSGSSLDPSFCTSVIGIVNFTATFIAAILVDRLGRKILMYASTAMMAAMLVFLGFYFYFLKVKHSDLSSISWLPLVCFVLYVLGFSFGLGPVPWLMMGEILPATIRSPAASISAAFNFGCSFLITKTFPLLVDSIGAHYVFWFFALNMGCTLVFLKLVVPETKNRTLDDIERILTIC